MKKPKTVAQSLIRELKVAEFQRGRLELAEYRIDVMPRSLEEGSSIKWYLCINGSPVDGGTNLTVENAQAASVRTLKRRIRKDHGEEIAQA